MRGSECTSGAEDAARADWKALEVASVRPGAVEADGLELVGDVLCCAARSVRACATAPEGVVSQVADVCEGRVHALRDLVDVWTIG